MAARPRFFSRFQRPAAPSAVIIAGLICLAITLPAAGQLRITNYNIARLNGDEAALQEVLEALMVDHHAGFAVAPAMMAFQEVRGMDIAPLEAIVHAASPRGILYIRGTYTTSVFEDGNGGAQAMFYRPDLLTEITNAHDDIATGAGRNTDRWRFTLNGYDSPAASFYLYSSHLRAGDDAPSGAEQLAGVNAIRANAATLPAGTHIVFLGDYNFGSNNEPAYQAFITPLRSGMPILDFLGSGSWAGMSHALKHTQSPRAITTGDLIGGGLDSRFDFQLSTGNMHDLNGLSIINSPLAYRGVGNDGLHYNLDINDGNNFYIAADLAASNALADALFDASDHIPVMVDYQVPAVMDATLPADFGRIITGATAHVALRLQNDADVVHPLGADVLDAHIATDGIFTGAFNASASAASPPTFVQLPLNTGKVGQAEGLVLVTSTSEAAQNSSVFLASSGFIVRPCNPSFSALNDINSLTIDETFATNSGVHLIDVPVHNFAFDELQALMDLEGVTGLGAPITLAGGILKGVSDEPAVLQFAINTARQAPGEIHSVLTIFATDEDLFGESSHSITLTLDLVITEKPTLTGDINKDGSVNGVDLGILLSQWMDPGSADLNGDGIVNGVDLGILLNNWTF